MSGHQIQHIERENPASINIPPTNETLSEKKRTTKESFSIITSCLTKRDTKIVKDFVFKFELKCSSKYETNATHLIANVNEKNCASRSIKFMRALAFGQWIVNIKWATACLAEGKLLDEEPYEVLDIYEDPGPMRLRKMERREYLNWLSVVLVGPFAHISTDVLQEILEQFGAQVLFENFETSTRCNLILIDSVVNPDQAFHKQWTQKLQTSVIDVTWLVHTICRGRLYSLVYYILSDCDAFNKNKNWPQVLFEVDSQLSETENQAVSNQI